MAASCARRARARGSIESILAAVEAMPGVLKVVRDGNFLGVIADKEWQAIKAMRPCRRPRAGRSAETLPDAGRAARGPDGAADRGRRRRGRAHAGRRRGHARVEATFTTPYQMHGSIGPSCALAQSGRRRHDRLDAHARASIPTRRRSPRCCACRSRQVRCIHVEGSGCYGHNGADDAAADAALLAQAAAGPAGAPAMDARAGACLGALLARHGDEGAAPGSTARATSSTGPTSSGATATIRAPAAPARCCRRSTSREPFRPEAPKVQITPEGNGDRNSNPLYAFPSRHVSGTSCRTCRCAFPRCAVSAPT